MPRRDALAVLGGFVTWLACGEWLACDARRSNTVPPPPLASSEPSDPAFALKLAPVVDLVPAAGINWLVQARPRQIAADPVLGRAVDTIIPPERFALFAQHHGGIDVRAVDELAVASYARATLVLALVAFDPHRVEAAFSARVQRMQGRAVERGVIRSWGTVRRGQEQIALFSREALAFERGELGPLRASLYFAEGRLHRSLPALRAEPLAAAAALAGDAPLRVFAAGPFEGEAARGVAGLLRATTAIAATLRPVAAAPQGAVALKLLLMGGWQEDAPEAAERLRSVFGVLAEEPLGRLSGLDRPVEGPLVSPGPGALRLEVTLDALAWARGLHTATGASVDEIMADG